jgi:hypothetical protein
MDFTSGQLTLNKKLAERPSSSCTKALRTFELIQIDPWSGFTEGTDQRRPNPARGLTGDEGQVGEKTQEPTAVAGVAGVGAEKG